MAESTAVSPNCAYFLARKKRYCKVTLIPGKKYCGLHAHLDTDTQDEDKRNRIPCPLDTKHTVYEDQMEKHLKKCNAREKPQPDYFQKNINSGSPDDGNDPADKITLSSLPRNELVALITKLKKVYKEHAVPISNSVQDHPALQSELVNPGNGATALKHLTQTSSLLGNMQQSDLLSCGTCFVEFGAGKGQLSHWVQKSLPDSTDTKFLLVDRGANRYKLDCYHKGSEDGPHFERIRIDIEHLCLGKVPSVADTHHSAVVAISKHLCGVATDFTLRCMTETLSCPSGSFADQAREQSDHPDCKRLKTDSSERLKGVVIALCCHHKCSWSSYVGREFFQTQGFSPRDFILVTRLTSWATCGTRPQSKMKPSDSYDATVPEAEAVPDDSDHSDVKEPINQEYRDLLDSMSVDEREDIGKMCKRLIDVGRMQYLQKKGLSVNLAYYVNPEISLENVVMIAKPK